MIPEERKRDTMGVDNAEIAKSAAHRHRKTQILRRGVERSFPPDLENSTNSVVIRPRTVC